MNRIDLKEEAIGLAILVTVPAVPLVLFVRPFALAVVLYAIAVVWGLLGRLVQNAFEAAIIGIMVSVLMTVLAPAVRQARQNERAARATTEAVKPIAPATESRLDHSPGGVAAPKPNTD